MRFQIGASDRGRGDFTKRGFPHKKRLHPVQKFSRNKAEFAFQGTLPNHQASPALSGQIFQPVPVTIHISENFLFPELRSGLGPFKEMALMPVPETAMDEYGSIVLFQNEIRFPRQF